MIGSFRHKQSSLAESLLKQDCLYKYYLKNEEQGNMQFYISNLIDYPSKLFYYLFMINYNHFGKREESSQFFHNYLPFSANVQPRPQSPLTFQKVSILPCNIYEQRPSKSNFKGELTTINEKGESIKTSEQNTHREKAKEEAESHGNILDISEQLLLSQKLMASRKRVGQASLCPSHDKNQDIICMVDRVRICSHCALFGDHKDHTFKSQAQFFDQLCNRQAKLQELTRAQVQIENYLSKDQEWKHLEVECVMKEREMIDELNYEFRELIKKIEASKKEIEKAITEQAQSVMQAIQQQSQICKREIQNASTFAHWAEQGRKIISNLKDCFETPDFDKCYRQYDTFSWQQGESIVSEEKEILDKIKQNIKKAIEDMKLNLNQSTMHNFNSSMLLNSQIHFAPDFDNSFTSLDDLHKHLCALKTEGSQKIASENEFLDFREFARFRNSECLETIHEPKRISIGTIDKTQRMSAKCFAKKNAVSTSKKENKPLLSSLSSNLSFMQRHQSSSKLETSILPPSRSKMKVVNSPKLRARPDPMSQLAEYQRSEDSTTLNLSDCNLSEDSLVYFLERAIKVRPPFQTNLSKNNLSSGGFTKLVPYLTPCSKINLSFCGLGESCLDSLLRTKALRKLSEIILTGNDINPKKNKSKLQQLKRQGIRVICA